MRAKGWEDISEHSKNISHTVTRTPREREREWMDEWMNEYVSMCSMILVQELIQQWWSIVAWLKL